MGRGVISLDVRLMDDVATPPPLPHQSTKPQKKTKKRTRQHARSATKRWDAQFFFYLIFFFWWDDNHRMNRRAPTRIRLRNMEEKKVRPTPELEPINHRHSINDVDRSAPPPSHTHTHTGRHPLTPPQFGCNLISIKVVLLDRPFFLVHHPTALVSEKEDQICRFFT